MLELKEVEVVAEGQGFVVLQDPDGLVYKVHKVLFPAFGFRFYRKPRTGDKGVVLLGLEDPIFIPMIFYEISELPQEIQIEADDTINADLQDVNIGGGSLDEEWSGCHTTARGEYTVETPLAQFSGSVSVGQSMGAQVGITATLGPISAFVDWNALVQALSASPSGPLSGQSLASIIQPLIQRIKKPS